MKSWIRVITAAVVCGVMAGCGSDDTVTTPTPITPVVTVPAIPRQSSVAPGDTVNTVQWSAVAGATSYTLYWSDVAPLTKPTATVIEWGCFTVQTHGSDERQASLLRGDGA